MNAMSVSPVKPPINSGNHAVPATATNLSKNPMPSSNNFTPINLVPENKSVPAVNATPASTENSVDLCSKPPPTSNGTVSPSLETKLKECPVINVQQNHTENCDTAENLSTTDNPPPKPVESVVEVKKVVEEEPKPVEIKPVTPPKGNSEPVKEVTKETVAPPKIEFIKETLKVEESLLTKQVKKDESPVKSVEGSRLAKQPETSAAPTESETVTEPKAETLPIPEIKPIVDEVKAEKAVEVEENVEKKVQKTEEVKSEAPAENTPTLPKTTKRKAKQPVEQVDEDSNEGRKSKRVRLPTQPYQSPIPELQFIAKLQTPIKTTPKPTTEKIIAFYKNEFLAVRNPEGSFYICQTFQNIHRSSSRIKIRWFTNLPQDIFTPDFCDHTEFDCILTNVKMTRVEKDRWKLPDDERTRIENILKRALDVEKGVVDKPSITEEHPDGLDLSLFKDEAQLKKKKRKKKKSASPNAAKKDTEKTKKEPPKPTKAPKTPVASTKKSARLSNLNQTPAKEAEKPKPTESKTKKAKKEAKKTKQTAKKSPTKQNDKSNAKVWEPSVKSSNSSRVVLSLKKEAKAETTTTTTTKTTAKRTSSVSSRASANNNSPTVPQKRRKEENKPAAVASVPASAERAGKVRNAGSAVTAKINSAAMRTTKDKERKVSNSSSQRKK